MIRVGLAALALVLAAEPVHAGSSCGGGGGGGGDSGGDSGGGSYDSGDSGDSGVSGDSGGSSACRDSTDVHGYRECTRYGVWARNLRQPRFYLELGTQVRQWASDVGGQSGELTHGGESFAFRTVMAPVESGRDVAMTSVLRLGVGLSHGLYAGAEAELGGLVAPASARTEMMSRGTYGSPVVDQGRGLVVAGAGVAGLRVDLGPGSIAIEGAAGVRTVQYTFASSYHDCESETTITATRGIVETRARADLWLTPWITAGATLGANMLERGDWMAGIYLGVQSRAYAGARWRRMSR